MECSLRSLIILLTIRSYLVSAQYGECSKGRTDYLPGVMQGFYESLSSTECQLAGNTQFRQYDPSNGEKFDFIIVGAGAAGSLLANKLSANPNWRILLLEAGGDPTMTTEIPGLVSFNFRTEIDWQYRAVPEDGIYWGRGPNGSVILSLGKGVGGSTLLNIMFYTRGNPDDYDSWEEAGSNGWSYRDLLPHFKRFENTKAEELLSCKSCMKYHGTNGELTLESFTNAQLDPYSRLLVEGFKTMGIGLHTDYNNPEMAKKGGYYFIQGTKKDGKRCNAGKAFIKPAENRNNLRLSKNSLVTKVLIDKSKTAYGVEFKNRFNQNIKVFASRETILSAGAVKTPQLLMLSGVGPRRHLQDLGIEVKHDLPVGANFQDHPLFPGVVITLNKQFQLTDKSVLDQLLEYITRSTGLMLTPGSMMAGNAIFIKSGNSSTGYPDVELLLSQLDKGDQRATSRFAAYTPDIAQQLVNLNKKKAMILLSLVLLRPKSIGKVSLRSSDPEDQPNIYTGYLKNEEDFYPIISAIRTIERLVASEPMRSVGAKLELFDYPRCRRFRAGSDDYWACAIRYLISTTFHPCCTVRMGPEWDKRAVVDSRLKVKGMSKLRAVDLSVTPTMVSAHTQATAYVISHKAADMILSDHLVNDKT